MDAELVRHALGAYRSALRSGEGESDELRRMGDRALELLSPEARDGATREMADGVTSALGRAVARTAEYGACLFGGRQAPTEDSVVDAWRAVGAAVCDLAEGTR